MNGAEEQKGAADVETSNIGRAEEAESEANKKVSQFSH